MRADRLLSILLLLQAHGRMSAAELARRVEVSRRTVFRDLEALSGAGIPVVSDRGPNGGAYLLGGYRTDLTGLTESELEALLAFGGQGPAAGVGDAEISDEPFQRPAGFDLRALWASQVGRFKASGPGHLLVKVRVDAEASGPFARLVGDQIVERLGNGVVVLDFPADQAAVSLLAPFGRSVEVLEPDALRRRPGEIGRQLSSFYAVPMSSKPAGRLKRCTETKE